MKTFSVKNFERFQHYKDRSPPWIKLYNELLDDYKFGALPDASKMHLIAIWLLASRSNNKIPCDPKWVAGRINANSKVDLDLLAENGFIVIDQPLRIMAQDASKPLAECLSREREEGETEERRDRGEEIAASPSPKVRKRPKGPLPESFLISDANSSYAKTLGFSDFEIRREHQKFCMRAKADGTLWVDWNAAEHNWLTKAAEFAGKRPRGEQGDVADDGLIEVLDQLQLDAWDAFGKKETGKAYPRNKKGGWRFPSKWPPGYEAEMLSGVQRLIGAQT